MNSLTPTPFTRQSSRRTKKKLSSSHDNPSQRLLILLLIHDPCACTLGANYVIDRSVSFIRDHRRIWLRIVYEHYFQNSSLVRDRRHVHFISRYRLLNKVPFIWSKVVPLKSITLPCSLVRSSASICEKNLTFTY